MVHHKDFAGHWRSNALEGFVEGGNSLVDMEVNIRSCLAAHDIAAVGLPIHLDPG